MFFHEPDCSGIEGDVGATAFRRGMSFCTYVVLELERASS